MTHLLVISSAHKTSNSTPYEGSIILPEEIKGNSKLSLLHAMMSNTVYTFSDVFQFEEAAGGPKTVTLTGAYTGIALATYLTTWMTANSTAAAAYDVQYNTTTGKFEVTTTPGTAHTITVATSNLAKRLGLAVGTTASTATHTSTTVADLSPPKGCIMEVVGLKKGQTIMCSSGGLLGHFFIPMTADSYGIVDYFEKSNFKQLIDLSEDGRPMKVFKYKLYDVDTRDVLLLQTDWQIVLGVE